MKLYEVTFNKKVDEIVVEHFEESKSYFCKFPNDISNGFYESFESFGFYVDKLNLQEKYILSGKLTEEKAKDIWSQIELKFDSPKHKASIKVPF